MLPFSYQQKVRSSVLFSICLIFLCSCQNWNLKDITDHAKLYPVERNISASEIVGVWNAVYDGVDHDTITIFDNGTYQQTFLESQPSNYVYESERHKWYLEESEEGMVYLHLQEGKYFFAGRTYLENDGWGNSFLYDPFSQSLVPWENELILVIVSDKSNNLFLHNLWVGTDNGFPVFSKDVEYFVRE